MKWTSVLVLAACSSTPAPKPVPVASLECSDLTCIEANEGKVIDLAGTFAFPTDMQRKGQHLYRVNLGDGTSVVLHISKRDAIAEKLPQGRDGQRVVVRGIVYSKIIPDKYGIIQRTSDPYCVELYDVK